MYGYTHRRIYGDGLVGSEWTGREEIEFREASLLREGFTEIYRAGHWIVFVGASNRGDQNSAGEFVTPSIEALFLG